MRIATYNVHDCVGRDGRFDPSRIAAVLAELDADLIALQEVTLDHAGDLIGQFEAATGMQAHDGSLFDRGVGRYGNVALTRYPVVASRLHDLAYPGREPRGLLELQLLAGDSPFRVGVTHLGLNPRERRHQLRQVVGMFDGEAGGAVLLGDFNVWWPTRAPAGLTVRGFTGNPVRSFPSWPVPVVALDRVFARAPLRIRRSWRHVSPVARIASDHYPVVADIDLSELLIKHHKYLNKNEL